ncbi:hypothetical protein XELAEV_18023996mg [Xenopus laevis]|uniref:Uncharacterized protein n=1 Tax=Xenopus laevis TaxID=8355 RepID=A0A974D7Y7_XENLA|nr:hypothetical protein XELAEV_18023996mg [Xenopus laevis]
MMKPSLVLQGEWGLTFRLWQSGQYSAVGAKRLQGGSRKWSHRQRLSVWEGEGETSGHCSVCPCLRGSAWLCVPSSLTGFQHRVNTGTSWPG